MYAISFDLDTEILKKLYHNESYNNAYLDIRRFLLERGFDWQQGSVYFGNSTINAVKCVMITQKLSQTFSWFGASVRDIRMLRIEELNDLKEALY
jgi:virulence-associated protein VapD